MLDYLLCCNQSADFLGLVEGIVFVLADVGDRTPFLCRPRTSASFSPPVPSSSSHILVEEGSTAAAVGAVDKGTLADSQRRVPPGF